MRRRASKHLRRLRKRANAARVQRRVWRFELVANTMFRARDLGSKLAYLGSPLTVQL